MWARTGAAVMTSPLFKQEQINYSAHAVPCPLCPASQPTVLDAYHLIAECMHPAVDRWRMTCEAALRRMVPKLLDVLLYDRDRAGHDTGTDELLFARAAVAVRNVDFDSMQGDFVLYRFLVAQPWSERMAVPGPGMRVVRLLGRVFDLPGVYHRFERPALDVWSRWSVRWLWRLSHVWKMATAA